jgi:predicted lipid-binding transport protein (Tim44 family)
MGEGFQTLEIILFAMIAAFLILRLRSVLGRRTGHEKPPPDTSAESRRETQLIDTSLEPADQNTTTKGTDSINMDFDGPVLAGLLDIKKVDPSFDSETFVEGAIAAFEIVVKAFAEGDLKTLGGLLNDEVLDNFSKAVEEREKLEETLQTTVIGINKAEIMEARVDATTAFINVKVISEQVNVMRDKNGTAINGDENLSAEVTDLWTFARDTLDQDPNWLLVETRSIN